MSRDFLRPVLLGLLGITAFGFTSAQAAPENGQVSVGAATIEQFTTETSITQTTDRAVIEWDSFDVGAGELVNITQPSSNAILVNRDLSGDLTQIDGDISANGQVFILNPAGIIFGENAFVDVGGLIASDLDLVGSVSETGSFTLSDPNITRGGVTNNGILRASIGGVALIGQQVRNGGEIRTQAGDVQLIAASEVTVLMESDDRIGFALTQPVRSLLGGSDYLVENTIDGVVVSIDGGDIVYSTLFVEDLLLGEQASIDQAGTENVLGITNEAGNIYISETPVQETLVDTVVDDVITTESEIATTDVGDTVTEIDDSAESLASADVEALKELDSEPEQAADASANDTGLSDTSTTTAEAVSDEEPLVEVASESDRESDVKRADSDETDSGQETATASTDTETDKRSEGRSESVARTEERKERANSKQKMALKIDPNYFAKLRKTHIDQLIPECKNKVECQDQQAMKNFLGKLLVDGEL